MQQCDWLVCHKITPQIPFTGRLKANNMCCVNDTTYRVNCGLVAAMNVPAQISSSSVNESRRRIKRVTFLMAEVVSIVTPSSEMTDRHRCELWYQLSDLADFKTHARELCKSIRECDAIFDNPILDASVDLELGLRSECARGFEHRISTERQKNKFLAMRAIIKAQQRFKSPERLAIVASKCTAWAKEIALCTGYQDFYKAYNPAMAHLVPSTPLVKFPLLSRKRIELQSADDELPSMKKARTLSPVPVRHLSSGLIAPVVLL